MPKNHNLHTAKSNKKDEFYTQLEDIENELKHYRNHFRGKTVYCNCDDPIVSNFYRYFRLNFEFLGLEKLITTCYKNRQMDMFSQHDNERAIGIEYSGCEPQTFSLKGDGDFRSGECVELLEQADIVVTNPPFSLFREYVAQLIDYDKKFVIIGNMNAVYCREIFPLIQHNKMWYGVSIRSGDRELGVPAHYPLEAANTRVDENGGRFIRVKGIRWFTNLDHVKRHEELRLYKRYTPDEYPKYDNYDAIEVSKTKEIPEDYAGVMGVPISFLDKYNPEQFEILGSTQRGCHDQVPDTRKYNDYWEVRQGGVKTGSSGNKTNENANLLGNDGRKNYFINREGRIIQSAYGRIFIRHKRNHA